MDQSVIDKDVQAIIDVGGNDNDVMNYLKENKVSFTEEQPAQPQSSDYQGVQPQNILGQIFNVPGAAVRGGIQAAMSGQNPIQGYTQGAIHPDSIPKFQDMAIQAGQNMGEGPSPSVGVNFAKGLIPSAAGLAADVVTDPAVLLMGLLGKAATPILKFNKELELAKKAKTSLDTLRETVGKGVQVAVHEVKDIPTELRWTTKSEKIMTAVKNPIYEIEFTKDGGIQQTVGNLAKIKKAVGELVTPKMRVEATKEELRQVKLFEHEVSSEMKRVAKRAGKPIDEAMSAYEEFMKRYNVINPKLVDKAGNAQANKLKAVFNAGAEPATKQAWKDVAKGSSEIKKIMGSMNRRKLLGDLVKAAQIPGGVAGGVYTYNKFFRD